MTSVTFGVILVATLVQAGRLLLAPLPVVTWAPPAVAPTGVSETIASSDVAADVGAIVATHLFGTVPEADPAVDVEAVEATTLALELRGLVASDDPRFAHAIIAIDGSNESLYFAGKEIPGTGATVERLLPDRVILRRSEALEALFLPRLLPRPVQAARSSGAGNAVAVGDPTTSRDGAATPRSAGAASVGTASAPESSVPGAEPTMFGQVVVPRPSLRAGQFEGVAVFPGSSPARFLALGLQPGDVITAIDGRPVQAQDLPIILRQPFFEARMLVTIRRGRTTKTLRIADGFGTVTT